MKINRRGTRHRPHGFTLIELMVTITVAAILAAVALPAVGTFVTQSRARAALSQLEAAFHYARAESMARAGRVGVCAVATPGGSTCAAPSAATGTAWTQGWIVYDKVNLLVLRRGEGMPSPFVIDGGARTEFVFDRFGLTSVDATGVMTNGTLSVRSSQAGAAVHGCLIVASDGGNVRRGTVGPQGCS